jgi:alcohol dehydrogenase (nicotinoprotein)
MTFGDRTEVGSPWIGPAADVHVWGAAMKTKAAVVFETGKPIEIEELDLDGPREGEVLIRYTYAGLCHSDVHIAHGDLEARLPMVLGHEGAGIIEEVGPGVTRVKEGDHVVCSFIPNCGTCRYCATGRQSICDMGATILEGYLPGEHFPYKGRKGDYGAMCMLGTFSQWGTIHQNSVVKVDDDLPLDKAVLVGCGVPTGWGAAVNTANVSPGDTVVVVGIGGIGINAVQGARYAGAKNVIAVDPLENKREKAMELGATHTFASTDEAMAAITDMTRGQMADSAILTPGLMTSEIVSGGFNAIGKGGTVVLTGLNKIEEQNIELSGSVMTLFRKSLKGSLFGDCNPTTDIPKILGLYQSGDIKLDEIITRTYTLEQVNEGYDDLLAGKNIRGIVVHDHS